MQPSILPLISECIIAFNLSLQQYITIGPCISMLSGYPENTVPTEADFWHAAIHPADIESVKEALSRLSEDEPVQVSYRTLTVNDPGSRYITEKRSIYTDAITNQQILLSILNESVPPVVSARPGVNDDALKREQFLLSLINSQTNFLVRLNTKGYFTFVNKRYCEVFGYTDAELIGQHFAINTAPEDMERCQRAFEECVAAPGKIIPLMREKLDKAGKRHPSEWEFISIINEEGDVTEIQGVGQDISQKVEIQNEVKRTVEKLNDFIESITDSFLILDNNWRFIKTNKAFEALSHKSSEELVGNSIWDVFPTLNGGQAEQQFRLAAETQQTLKFTEYVESSRLWLRIAVYPSAEGLTVFIKDITRQKIAEKELDWARSNLEALINNTDDLIWSLDKNNRYVFFNTSYRDVVLHETGIVPVNGQDVVIYGPAQTIEIWAGYYRRALSGERYTVIYENTHSGPGEPLYFEVSFNPIYNDAQEIVGTGCFAREITARLRTEREIVAQNERLRQIASLSSHELRRPVASMLGLINVIDFEDFACQENKEAINLLLVVGNEIDEVIRAIVDNTFTGEGPALPENGNNN
ncbi:PAS domain S-box protein [Mucilaginibacter gilvus]|uniref:histidine kinase n=1 Tax=Mucilaginibacter gilvus TaxID=2305909 RepID=A0A3S3WY01_9SPHI|nr:PAS domain S-box protein [Mucilaginibacter gilvus]RWY46277.1 PAS domain S-box protein [Mucilaginibacter gilvus]